MKRHVAAVRGRVYTHRVLWYTVEFFLDEAERNPRGAYHHYLGAALFAYLAFEAFLNDTGTLLAAAAWKRPQDTFSSKSDYPGTLGRLRFLAKEVGVTIDPTSGSYLVVEQLKKHRHFLAHARREVISRDVEVPGPSEFPKVPAKIYSVTSPEFVRGAAAAVEDLSNRLHRGAQAKFGHLDLAPGGEAMRGISEGCETVIGVEYT